MSAVRDLYLGTGAGAAFATLHEAGGDVGVLLVPPFGWDEVCSYRARRAWAERLAAGGRPALRLTLPGTGDAGGGPYDADRLPAWTTAIGRGADLLRDEMGCARVVAIGIGLGGLLACAAVREGAAIDDLVLWAVPRSGKAFLRELRAFARLEMAEEPAQPAPLPEGAMLAGGFAISAQTKADLTPLAPELPPGPRRVLLLGRDGAGGDEARPALEAAGAAVTVDAGSGYAAMMAKPDETVPPVETFARVDAWLAEAPAPVVAAPRPDAPAPPVAGVLDLEVDGVAVVERPLALAVPGGPQLAAIACAPAGGARGALAAVFLNAGAIRRIGPNRLWVETARCWAARGVTSVRVDLAGLGDSPGPDEHWAEVGRFYAESVWDEVRAALDATQAAGLGDRFAVVGLCSGGYWAIQAAARDGRVELALPVNPGALVWDPGLSEEREVRRLRKLGQAYIWRKALRGAYSARELRGIASAAAGRLRRGSAVGQTHGARVDALLDAIDAGGASVLMVVGPAEPVGDELRRDGQLERMDRWPRVRVERLEGTILAHTLRPAHLQQRVRELLDDALDRELQAATPPRSAR